MTTGDCCHLPGSLCDCPGSAALSKSVEDAVGRPQFVTQVTAKDGRLLSTVIKALGTQSDGPICRICHEGGNGEGLLSPCDCTGTLGTVHKSCLEKWLSSSNTSYCELCHTEFVVERRPRPLTEVPLSSCFTFLSIPPEKNDRVAPCGSCCLLLLSEPRGVGLEGSRLWSDRVWLQRAGLGAALTGRCVVAPQVSFRYHCQLYSEWRRTNQKVRLMLPASRSPHPVPHSLLSTKLLKKSADETTV
ncbi:MARH2 ligase, partial [Centropus unirufus]|nr:MARH2 ligase [Centropus unirufus]